MGDMGPFEIVGYAAAAIVTALNVLLASRTRGTNKLAAQAEEIVASLRPPDGEAKRLPIVRVPCPQHDDLVEDIRNNRRSLRALKRGQNEILEYLTDDGNGGKRRIHEDVDGDDTGRYPAVQGGVE